MGGTYARTPLLMNGPRRDEIGSSNGLGIMLRALRRMQKQAAVDRAAFRQPSESARLLLVTSAPRPLRGNAA
jgi:hypothetical protein